MRSLMRWFGIVLSLFSMAIAPSVVGAGLDKTYRPGPDAPLRILPEPLQRLFGGGRSYAVVIGVSEYMGEEKGGFAPLQTAANDADRMARFLYEQAGFDYVRVLTEEKVSKAAIEELMQDTIPGLIGPGDRFLFYWSGHGTSRTIKQSDGRRTYGYLPLAKSRREQYSSMISMADVRRWDELIRGKQTLFILDACLSGLAGFQSKNGSRALTLKQLDRPSRQLFAAGSANDVALADDRWNGSLFTDAILKGAAGEADREADGVVSLAELLAYVRAIVAHETSLTQQTKAITPQVQLLQPSAGDFFFLTAWPKSKPAQPRAGTAGGDASPKGGQDSARSDWQPSEVSSAQSALRELGFVVGKEGALDRPTEDALLAFQSLASLDRTGSPDAATMLALTRMRDQTFSEIQPLRDEKLEIIIVYQIGAEPKIDALTSRLRGAGINYTLSDTYNVPNHIAGRLYFRKERADAAQALRTLADGLVELYLTPSETAGDTLRLTVGLGTSSDSGN